MLEVNREIRIPLQEIELTYVRSSGPGGQNVNKVNSKCLLRWNLAESPSISEATRLRILNKLGDRISNSGDIVLTSDRFRDQLRNRDDCLEKLRAMLSAAALIPKPRKKTKPSRSSKQRAKAQKSRHSEKKRLRRGWDSD